MVQKYQNEIVPILLQISWILQNTPNFCNLMVLKGVMDKKPKKSDNGKYAILKLKLRPYFTMELVQKLMKKT